MTKKEIVFDIEANGLNPDKIWCIVAKPINEPAIEFGPNKLKEGLEYLDSADTLIGHNILGFDIPVIEKLYNINLLKNKNIKDTLVMSRLFQPVRENGHSLKTWGYRIGYPKAEQPEDWDNYTSEMLKYCKHDVILNSKVYKYLLEEGKGFSEESLELESKIASILKEQEQNGFKFNEAKASILVSKLKDRMRIIEKEVKEVFQPRLVPIKRVIPKLKKDGTLSKSGLTAEEYEKINKNFNVDHKEFTNFSFMRKELREFNLGSRKQIGEYLIEFGWKPEKFTPTGQPIVDESTLSNIKNIPEAQLIAEYLLLQKRFAQIESWIEALEKDGRVHGFVIPNGTITGRMTHRSPNMAQVPSATSEYGKECRECWIVEEENKLIGIDASSLELRMLAHYMNDDNYTREVINGDIHTTNQKLAGLKSRDQSKTFIYALCYGAGDQKLSTILGGNKTDAKRIREHFLDNLPSFKRLKNRVGQAAQRGWLKGLDGRKLYVRHEHAALNTLLQGGGAIVMKRALAMLDSVLKLNTIPIKYVANIHDEWQIEVPENRASFVGELAIGCIRKAGEYYNMRCPLSGEYKIGENWSETH